MGDGVTGGKVGRTGSGVGVVAAGGLGDGAGIRCETEWTNPAGRQDKTTGPGGKTRWGDQKQQQ